MFYLECAKEKQIEKAVRKGETAKIFSKNLDTLNILFT
jgi:hypothetical protein